RPARAGRSTHGAAPLSPALVAARPQSHLSPLTVGPRAHVALFKTLGAVSEALPERVDVWIGRHAARIVGRFSAGARAALSANLSRALAAPGAVPDPELLERFVERGFDSYGQYWAE